DSATTSAIHSFPTRRSSDLGKTYWARNSALALGAGLQLLTMLLPFNEGGVLVLWTTLSVLLVTTALVGRALFYVLVIPTTMPGADRKSTRLNSSHVKISYAV